MLIRSVGALALLLIPATAWVQAPSAQSSAKQNSDPNRLICERRPVTGSLVKTERVCRTAREWETMRARTRALVEDWTSGAHCEADGSMSVC